MKYRALNFLERLDVGCTLERYTAKHKKCRAKTHNEEELMLMFEVSKRSRSKSSRLSKWRERYFITCRNHTCLRR